MKEQIYITKYKGVELVHTPMGLKDLQGNKVRSVRCNFVPTEYGYAFITADPMLIAWLEKHEYMMKGKIEKFDGTALPVEPAKVAKGVTSNVDTTEPADAAPAVKKTEPHTVRIRK